MSDAERVHVSTRSFGRTLITLLSMAELFLLDTSAFLTLTDREPGVDRVRHLLRAAKRGEVRLYGCFVSLVEAQYILTYDLGLDRARRIVSAIRKFSHPLAPLGRGFVCCRCRD